MSIFKQLESLGVQMAFAEANAWEPCLAQTPTNEKEQQPVTTATLRNKRARKLTVMYGIASLALYGVTFANASEVLHQSSMGGFHAIVPITTVFLFSWIHGNFTGNLWTALGIEASTKTTCKPSKKPEIKKDTRPRATIMQA